MSKVPELTSEDIELLMQSLDALEMRDGMTSLMGSMLTAGFARSEEEFKAKMDKQRAADQEREQAQKAMRYRIMMLKAKLAEYALSLDADVLARSVFG